MKTRIVDRKYLIFASLLVFLLAGFLLSPPKLKPNDHSVFVYGTLKYPIIRNVVCLCRSETNKVSLPDFKKDGLNIVPSVGDRVEGRIIYVSEKELDRLDRYENTPIKYRREEILIGGTEHFVYLLNQ
jgi:gamma-glutamylcyclotransferase (GGCT)/AIG2-like uncharacterized protein YtfP